MVMIMFDYNILLMHQIRYYNLSFARKQDVVIQLIAYIRGKPTRLAPMPKPAPDLAWTARLGM